MKKRSVFLPTAIIFLVISVILVTHLTISYLMDYERADNIITIGKVDLELSEGSFPESSIISPGGTLTKAPMITNNGINDEYVFLTIAVPKKYVTLLYEKNEGTEHKEGEKVAGYPAEVEIFKIIANGETVANGGNVDIIPDSNTPKKVEFSYHKGNSSTSAAGWVYLEKPVIPSGINSDGYDVYSFGYNKKLIAGDDNKKSTITLFDEIRLKSFIDEELSTGYVGENPQGANVDIIVTAYGIQADDLGITGLPSDDSNSIISDENVGKIFTIVKNKQ